MDNNKMNKGMKNEGIQAENLFYFNLYKDRYNLRCIIIFLIKMVQY